MGRVGDAGCGDVRGSSADGDDAAGSDRRIADLSGRDNLRGCYRLDARSEPRTGRKDGAGGIRGSSDALPAGYVLPFPSLDTNRGQSPGLVVIEIAGLKPCAP